jgi:DinB superfamily
LRKRPAADKWSVSEIVAHLGDAEIVIGFRMRLILGAPGTPIAAYNQDSWVTSGHYEERDPRKSIEQFRVVREANLALLKSLTPVQWNHYGMHSERGQETIEHIVRMTAGHEPPAADRADLASETEVGGGGRAPDGVQLYS